ncbi:hypothetical protein [Enterobacter hormaechei]|uniref:hypothetical protein n=1 Tax=Enterobacter hormaechei TaxID=158836 RepID=UPI000CEC59CA|nr:hypothetical protein [Enterobacter hormaechei]ROC77435.1 hypothetical protein C4Z25_014655 [Enterobacter hormaechei subsp. steigerwaltii]
MQFEELKIAHIEHIRAVARELGTGWYYHEITSHDRCAKLRSRAERHLWVNCMLSQGRYRLSAGLDRDYYDYSGKALITVAPGRSPASIAADIRRRLLPQLGDTLEKAAEYRASMAAKTERHGWLKNLLLRFCTPLYSHSDHQKLFEFTPPAGVRFEVTETSHSGGEYDITLKNLSLDDVVRIAAIAGQAQQRNTDEKS